MKTLTRWHWRLTVGAGEERGNRPRRLEFHLDALHIPANPDVYPFEEGHVLTLEWHDPFYPDDVDRAARVDQRLGRREQREKWVTEKYRRYGRDGLGVLEGPFWDEQVNDTLFVRVGLAKPEARFGDDLSLEGAAFRVSLESDEGRTWYVAQVNPQNPDFSVVTEEAGVDRLLDRLGGDK